MVQKKIGENPVTTLRRGLTEPIENISLDRAGLPTQVLKRFLGLGGDNMLLIEQHDG